MKKANRISRFIKRLPKSIVNLFRKIIFGTHHVNPRWLIKLKIENWRTKKIRVGFGPITTGENDLAERKWRIDPIIDRINATSSDYSAGLFTRPSQMKNFDILIIVKKFNPSYISIIKKLKNDSKKFIYDIVDNPNCERKYRFYFGDHPEFCKLMDGFILSSPLHQPIVEPYSNLLPLIEHPIIHNEFKTEFDDSSIRILAHGYYANLINHKMIEPLLPKISEQIGKKVYLVYHTEVVFPDSDYVKYVKWTPENCFTEITKADIVISIKDLIAEHQKTKPSTKLISFMSAGLPVICTPTEADLLVMQHGVTGFFAYQLDEWETYITFLAKDANLRKEIGNRARIDVQSKYTLEKITDKYISLLSQV